MTTNDITGDTMRTKPASDAYLDNYDAIFRRKPEPAADWPESAEGAGTGVLGQDRPQTSRDGGSMTRKKDHRSERARAKLIEAMRDKGQRLTRKQSCELLNITVNNQNYRHLRRLHAEGLVHVARYEIKSGAQPAEVFAWGKGVDAQRPPVKSRTRINNEWRKRQVEKIGETAWRAIRKAYRSGSTALIVSGMPVWRKGQGINLEAARAAFGR